MAQLKDLIQAIADPRLRAQIASEVGKLKARKKFGLVFEQHLPRDGPVAESSGQAWYSCRVPRRPGGAVCSPYRRDGLTGSASARHATDPRFRRLQLFRHVLNVTILPHLVCQHELVAVRCTGRISTARERLHEGSERRGTHGIGHRTGSPPARRTRRHSGSPTADATCSGDAGAAL